MWKEFRIAVSFLTRLPLTYKGEWDEKSFSRASVFYPVVGLIVGFCAAVVAALLKLTGCYSVAAVCALITAICISGGIHLDGFMDMCDGIFASRGREKALEIMKDSPLDIVEFYCPLEICRQRNIDRGDRYETQSEEQAALMAKDIRYSMRVDTGVSSPEECAEQILRTLF